MASSFAQAFKYDVFLSFRGEDTRNTFTSHLYAALVGKNIKTYIDYELVRGDEIAPALLEAIEKSKLSVVILSQDYASSTWCLDELAHILECKERHGQIVVPIFYRTDPSHVRHQRESYAAAFLQHEERFKDMQDKVLKWRDALTKASKLAGFDSRNIGLESKLVEVVVTDVVLKLNRECSSDLEGLVAIESRIQKLESLLCIVPQDVRVRTVGIWGMGGIGKTTLADAVFNRFSSQFYASCFLANVRERSEKHGLIDLRNELLCNLLKDESARIGTPSVGSTFTKKRLSRAKVLIVLDDVNDVSQLEILAGNQIQFEPGSRIIITTRDMHILREMQQLQKGADHDVVIYKAEELDHHEAHQLFHLNNSEEISSSDGSSVLVREVVHYAAGIPLALKMWGSLFRRCKSTQEQKSFLAKLKRFPEKKLQNVYRISYDALGENEKEIFLYIACFHKGHEISSAIEQLNACGLFADIGIEVLVDMSLISIIDEGWSSPKGKTRYLWMHDVIQEMGWAIECEQHPAKPGKRTRLCTPEDICGVLENNKGTKKVQSISLNLSMNRKLQLTPQSFKKMRNLKFLKLHCNDRNVYSNLQNLEYLPETLINLSWPAYTLKYLPSTFSAENLTELSMPHSRLQRLWNEGQKPRNIKRIDLSYSEQLVEVPDLSMSVNIEIINLEGCGGLVEVPSYFQNLHKLISLNLSSCTNLSVLSDMPCNMVLLELDETAIEDLPSSIWSLEKLVTLNLNGCEGIKNIPNSIWKLYFLTSLNLSGTNIEGLPSSIECLFRLETLELQDCKKFASLPTSICKLKRLKELLLYGCSNFETFPEILEPMKHLECLGLGGTKFKELPSLIENVVGQKDLVLSRCTSFEPVPNSMLPPPSIILWSSMSTLNLRQCTMVEELPDCIFTLNMLYELDVSGTMIRTIPSTINQASRLRRLYLVDCKRLESLPQLPYLQLINASGCTRLKTVSWSTTALSNCFNETDCDVTCLYHGFFNCPSLDENAKRHIMDEAHLRNMVTFYYPVQRLQYEVKCSGNEIPKWVSNQVEGSSIDITLPLHWSEDATFMGLVYCVILNFHEAENAACLARGRSIFKNENGKCGTYEFTNYQRYQSRCDDENSDHLVAWYDSLQMLTSDSTGTYLNATQASFRFYIPNNDEVPPNSDDEEEHCWVKNPVKRCGVGFVYAQGRDNAVKWEVKDDLSWESFSTNRYGSSFSFNLFEL